MQKHFYLTGFALITGICGAAIRAAELSRGFEPETGLQIPGEPASMIMRVFSIAVIVLLAVFAMLLRGRLKEGLRILSGEKNTLTQILITASALMLVASAGYEFAAARDQLPLSEVIQVLLALFAAASILIRLAKPGREYAFFSLVPIFWCCFWLILIYRDRSIDPVVADYVYELFAVVAAALFFYGIAGYDFGALKLRLYVFFGLAAVYLSVVTALGPVLAKFLYGTEIANPETLLYFVASALFGLGGTLWLLNRFNRDSEARHAA